VSVAEWWRDHLGGKVRLGKSTYSLYAKRGDAAVPVLIVYFTGEAQGTVASIAKALKLADADEVLARYRAAGFAGGTAGLPNLKFDPTIEERRIRVQALLEWVAATVARGGGPADE
jgi:hypothetical protein